MTIEFTDNENTMTIKNGKKVKIYKFFAYRGHNICQYCDLCSDGYCSSEDDNDTKCCVSKREDERCGYWKKIQ